MPSCQSNKWRASGGLLRDVLVIRYTSIIVMFTVRVFWPYLGPVLPVRLPVSFGSDSIVRLSAPLFAVTPGQRNYTRPRTRRPAIGQLWFVMKVCSSSAGFHVFRDQNRTARHGRFPTCVYVSRYRIPHTS